MPNKEKADSFRIGFGIIALAWAVVWLPLVGVAFKQVSVLSDFHFIFALAVSTIALIGAIGSFWYKNWAARTYLVASLTFVFDGLFGGPAGERFNIPWGPIIITGIFCLFWYSSRDRFS